MLCEICGLIIGGATLFYFLRQATIDSYEKFPSMSCCLARRPFISTPNREKYPASFSALIFETVHLSGSLTRA
jgi:hypothetical protein